MLLSLLKNKAPLIITKTGTAQYTTLIYTVLTAKFPLIGSAVFHPSEDICIITTPNAAMILNISKYITLSRLPFLSIKNTLLLIFQNLSIYSAF